MDCMLAFGIGLVFGAGLMASTCYLIDQTVNDERERLRRELMKRMKQQENHDDAR